MNIEGSRVSLANLVDNRHREYHVLFYDLLPPPSDLLLNILQFPNNMVGVRKIIFERGMVLKIAAFPSRVRFLVSLL